MNVIDPDFFERLQIVINNHSARVYDGHLTNPPWLQPAALNGSESFIAEQKQRFVTSSTPEVT
jgi:hypothetical protein